MSAGPLLPAHHARAPGVELFAEGSTTKDVADRPGSSGKTVATHRERIMGKLHVHSIALLTKLAIREGLTTT